MMDCIISHAKEDRLVIVELSGLDLVETQKGRHQRHKINIPRAQPRKPGVASRLLIYVFLMFRSEPMPRFLLNGLKVPSVIANKHPFRIQDAEFSPLLLLLTSSTASAGRRRSRRPADRRRACRVSMLRTAR